MSNSKHALPKGSRVLVTGANGYIASHVVDQLLSHGYLVRGTIRAPKPWLSEYFAQKYGDVFEAVIVTCFENRDDINRVLDGVDGIIHLVSAALPAVIPWVVKATTNILESAAGMPSIKRVVLVSSSNGLSMLTPNPNGGVLHESKLILTFMIDSWCDEAVKAAWDPNTPDESKGFKTEAEREAWTWVRGHKPEYTFNTVLPCMTVILCKIIGAITRSADQLHNMLEDPSPGDLRFHDGVDPQTLERRSHGFVVINLNATVRALLKINLAEWYVDVEDLARLCAVGLSDPSQMNWFDAVSLLRQLRPKNTPIADVPEENIRGPRDFLPRGGRAEELLRTFYGLPGWTSIRDSLEKGIEGCE
ncbi:hypothetical protein Ao3042_07491 [Aspergillus oryzae 3.042]|uniref:NAD-dependent epimerase/dehydratase domain-containing protein n=1 Tax=Aspergillus oryzae (strain 3.042) TaxID=1160506 RepID=I7ZWB3_ASPO3|nr:hypothetical protein Ao3042_07491 [Aspergillus oryzae 3.042]|eukprot:EIT76397.1 hypothetical protein Ao3042_07491 [Aspergillus oryzae 3.042]